MPDPLTDFAGFIAYMRNPAIVRILFALDQIHSVVQLLIGRTTICSFCQPSLFNLRGDEFVGLAK